MRNLTYSRHHYTCSAGKYWFDISEKFWRISRKSWRSVSWVLVMVIESWTNDGIDDIIISTYIPLAADNMATCGWRFEHAKHIANHVLPRNLSLRFSDNSKANASELLENLEEMFPRYKWVSIFYHQKCLASKRLNKVLSLCVGCVCVCVVDIQIF